MFSAVVLYVEGIAGDFGDAIYLTAIAMLGNPIAEPDKSRAWVRWVTMLDGLAGLLLLGLVVWVATVSFDQEKVDSQKLPVSSEESPNAIATLVTPSELRAFLAFIGESDEPSLTPSK